MKIITWNVNGLRACLKKGFLNYVSGSAPDIIAVQETKLNNPLKLELHGYTAAWNFAERSGYSGTLCLFKHTPLSITYGFNSENSDNEGRVITLEYAEFYFVNAYVPNSQGDLSRLHFRIDWDEKFLNYITGLQEHKPVIIGGDLNVARDYIDIYPENLRNDENAPGFLSEERTGFNSLLDTGFKDIFRELYPSQVRSYTWWSNRLNKRKENRGWRIDYFLATDSLFPKIQDCKIRSDVYGSDHAPLELLIDLTDISKDEPKPIKKTVTDISKIDEAYDDIIFEKMWREINWDDTENTLREYQRRIALAASQKDNQFVIEAQRQLAGSFEAKALAVRHVSHSVSQPGIDKVKWTTNAQKMKAVYSLDKRNYSAQPMRLLKTRPKGQSKERHIQIDSVLKTLLLQLCEELHPFLPRPKIIKKYFYKEADGEYVYALAEKPDVRVMRIADTILIEHRPVQTKMNPYLDGEYYNLRTGEREISAVTGKYKPIWLRQSGKCYYCGKPILKGEEKTLVLIDPSRSETPKNQAYVHGYCALGEAEFYDIDLPVDTEFDLHKLLTNMSAGKISMWRKKTKFTPLAEYFRQKKVKIFTLEFAEIEDILGVKLCATARKSSSYWYDSRSAFCISRCWQLHGYQIKTLECEKERIIFEKISSDEKIDIPEVFLSANVPKNVKIIVENFLKHIKEKYGL